MGRITVQLATLTCVALAAPAVGVDFSEQLVRGSDVGRFSSLAVDRTGRLVISYYDAGSLDHGGAPGGLRLWYDANSNGASDPRETPTLTYVARAGEYNAVAVHPWDQTALIAYYDRGNHGLIVGVGQLPPACLKGDVNDDGQVTSDDVGPFVDVLLDATAGWHELCAADVNSDGQQNGADIQDFTTCLLGGPCP